MSHVPILSLPSIAELSIAEPSIAERSIVEPVLAEPVAAQPVSAPVHDSAPAVVPAPHIPTVIRVARELAAMLQTLGVHALVRDAESNAVLATTPGAPERILLLPSSLLRVSSCEVSGYRLIVESPEPAAIPSAHDLTPRQATITELVAQGYRNREIAERLGLSPHTVRRHVEAVLRRLGVRNRAAAAAVLHATREQTGDLAPRPISLKKPKLQLA